MAGKVNCLNEEGANIHLHTGVLRKCPVGKQFLPTAPLKVSLINAFNHSHTPLCLPGHG